MNKPSPYRELISVLDALPLLLREHRRKRQLSLRDAADAIGCGFNTIYRIENGGDCQLSNAVAVLRWLDHS